VTVWSVTGVAGFIGSNLAQKLLERGDEVVGLDNFSTGRHANIDRLNGLGGKFRFIEGDIRDPGCVRSALDGADCVAHLAAQVSVQKSIDDPVDSDATNVGGFVSVVDAAARAGISRVIYASSCAVYGENPKLPLDEGENPAPMSPYAVSKYANDLYAAVLADLNENIDIVGLRFFNIFGPWQDATGGYAAVIPRWIGLMMGGGEATIFGDGRATRDFCHVDNVSEAIIRIAMRTKPLPQRVYNIGTGVQTSLLELHQALVGALEAVGRPVEHRSANHLPWKSGDIVHSVASIERARREIGYEPSVSLAQGLENILAEEYGLFVEKRTT
jgi:UDP-N-acetylglucosamine 4-epimerase